MTTTLIGASLTSRVEMENSPEVTNTESGAIVVRRYKQKVGTSLIAYGTADADYAGSKMREVKRGEVKGGYETITYTFKPNVSPEPSLPPVGTVILEADANASEVPIRQHADYSHDEEVDGEKVPVLNGNQKPGVESFLQPQPIFRRREVLDAFTWSEANIIANVGTRNPPTGLTSPAANKWLKTGLTVRQVGDKYEKEESWQYSPKIWDLDIYD